MQRQDWELMPIELIPTDNAKVQKKLAEQNQPQATQNFETSDQKAEPQESKAQTVIEQDQPSYELEKIFCQFELNSDEKKQNSHYGLSLFFNSNKIDFWPSTLRKKFELHAHPKSIPWTTLKEKFGISDTDHVSYMTLLADGSILFAPRVFARWPTNYTICHILQSWGLPDVIQTRNLILLEPINNDYAITNRYRCTQVFPNCTGVDAVATLLDGTILTVANQTITRWKIGIPAVKAAFAANDFLSEILPTPLRTIITNYACSIDLINKHNTMMHQCTSEEQKEYPKETRMLMGESSENLFDQPRLNGLSLFSQLDNDRVKRLNEITNIKFFWQRLLARQIVAKDVKLDGDVRLQPLIQDNEKNKEFFSIANSINSLASENKITASEIATIKTQICNLMTTRINELNNSRENHAKQELAELKNFLQLKFINSADSYNPHDSKRPSANWKMSLDELDNAMNIKEGIRPTPF